MNVNWQPNLQTILGLESPVKVVPAKMFLISSKKQSQFNSHMMLVVFPDHIYGFFLTSPTDFCRLFSNQHSLFRGDLCRGKNFYLEGLMTAKGRDCDPVLG